jgi:hypothetical protein
MRPRHFAYGSPVVHEIRAPTRPLARMLELIHIERWRVL